ncbi:hypothetical protein MYXO_03150 [Myxococcaceae bacterium]|nr:hypothetical protein MYXO_03150 [Myxococcaceae bacterium]
MLRRTPIVFLAWFAAVASGCAGFFPRTDPPSFYVLSASHDVATGPPLDVAVGVGPIELPAYLDRPQFVTRKGPNQLDLAENERWASPLQKAATNALLLNLARQLGTDRVSSFPYALGLPRDYDASVQFLRFEASASGEVFVDAYWWILDPKTGTPLAARLSSLSRSAAAGDAAAAAAALSSALSDLSTEMAAAIREIHARRASG